MMLAVAETASQSADLWWSVLGLVIGWAGGFSLGYYVGRKRK